MSAIANMKLHELYALRKQHADQGNDSPVRNLDNQIADRIVAIGAHPSGVAA